MSFFNELKRRNVFKVAIAYVVSAWLLLQVADVLVPMLELPEWTGKLIFLFLLVGFLPALIFAWAFELTPDGLKRDKDVNPAESITAQTGQKLNYAIIAVLVVALGYFVADKFWLGTGPVTKDGAATADHQESQPRSIAVLPLADMSPQGDHEYFSDGLTEELLNILAKIEDLRVAGRTSSFAFKGKNEDLREIARKLDVSSILEGSVRKDDARNRVRITLQLINAEDGYHLWSETYDRELDDIFTIQEDVAREVATALKVTLLGQGEEAPHAVATADLNAYDLYLRGLQNLNMFSYASLERAVSDFQKALNLDPTYTSAQIGLMRTWQRMEATGAMPEQEALDRVQPLLALLLQREPENSEAHQLAAWVHSQNRDWAAAETARRRALQYNPGSATALGDLGMFLINRERLTEGLGYLEQAARLDPYSTDILRNLCWTYLWTRKFEESLQNCEKVRQIDPENPSGYYTEAIAHAVNGNLAQAVVWNLRAHEVDPDDHELQAEIGEFWLALGDASRANEWIERSLESGLGAARPVSAKISLLMHREQFTQAKQLAAAHLEIDGRRDSRSIIRNAVVIDALGRGDWRTAAETFREAIPWALEDPMHIDPNVQSWNVRPLIELAMVLKTADLSSERAESLLVAAGSIIDGADQTLAPYIRDLNDAALNAANRKPDQALAHLHRAFDNGLRENWRFWIQHWFVFAALRSDPEYRRLVERYETDMERQLAQARRLVSEEFGP
ncbi:MAG: tetratricopeptide repeat protein [Xanthomonadales bacterium]|nr:tetratricopeptide repeat protein [Xanthomonadales bacterium]